MKFLAFRPVPKNKTKLIRILRKLRSGNFLCIIAKNFRKNLNFLLALHRKSMLRFDCMGHVPGLGLAWAIVSF
jgi:hypothetical protein